jgi:hypothetical protein
MYTVCTRYDYSDVPQSTLNCSNMQCRLSYILLLNFWTQIMFVSIKQLALLIEINTEMHMGSH